jgi:NADPH:quinone reductase-like Zn-dependent oxidoreductase
MVRQGAIDNPPKTPFTMGFECAGEVEALGENVEGFQVCAALIDASKKAVFFASRWATACSL